MFSMNPALHASADGSKGEGIKSDGMKKIPNPKSEIPNSSQTRSVSSAHAKFMQAAVRQAQIGRSEGGIPIGAVLVHKGKIVGRGRNQRIQKQSPTLHGEIDALENAGRRTAKFYRECVLYTTLSPCSMCSGAILLYGIPTVVVGENRNFRGEENLLRRRGVDVIVLQDPECITLMRQFIEEHPGLWNEDIGE